MPKAPVTVNFEATQEDVAAAVLSSLLSSVHAQYTASVVGWSLVEAQARLTSGSDLPPASIRRGWLQLAFDDVIALLPANSPFRGPLTRLRDAEVAEVEELPQIQR